MLKQTERIKENRLRGFGLSCMISLAVPIIVAFIMSVYASTRENSTSVIAPYALISIVVSGVICGFINGRRCGMKRTLLASFMAILLMLAFGIIVSASAPKPGAFMNYACFMLTSLTGAYLGKKREKNRRRSHRR